MKFLLTEVGREYMARVNAGQMPLHLTKAVAGSGYDPDPEGLIRLTSEKQTIQLDEVTAEGEYTYIVCVLTNLEWEEEYLLQQLGLYAADPTGKETLLIVGQDEIGEFVPAITDREVEYQFYIGVQVSNSAQITFDFNINDFLRKKFFLEHLAEFETYKSKLQEQIGNLPTVRIGAESLLDRNNVILLRTILGNRIDKILERDAAGQRKDYLLASVFTTPEKRSALVSGDTIDDLMGKINRYLLDLKPVAYKDGDDPFVLMTETTYKPPSARQKGSLYGMVTKLRNMIILFCSRYVQGLEDPRQAMTIYGVETSLQTENTKSDSPAKAILDNFVQLPETGQIQREQYMLYGRITKQKGA